MRRSVILAALSCAICGGWVVGDTTVNVTPSNMNGWSFVSFDGGFNPVSSGSPYFATGQMVPGPAGQPLGSGSAQLETNSGHGDGAVDLETDNFDGMSLSALNSLSYSAYSAVNNGQQFPYLIVGISTTGGTTADDFLEYEPPYDPNQATSMNTWQSWNALDGGWYDENGTDSSSPSDAGVVSLAALISFFPDATIADLGTQFPGFGGINLQVGFASSGDDFNGYVDAFSIGTAAAGTTTANFDPAPSAPLPASAWSGLVLLGGFGAFSGIKRLRKQVA